MAIYAIGDIQGCYDSLQKLLKKIKFNPKKDTVWFAGDLVKPLASSISVLMRRVKKVIVPRRSAVDARQVTTNNSQLRAGEFYWSWGTIGAMCGEKRHLYVRCMTTIT